MVLWFLRPMDFEIVVLNLIAFNITPVKHIYSKHWKVQSASSQIMRKQSD